VEEVVNKDLAKFGTQIGVPELGSMIFDFSLLTNPTVKDFIGLDLNGTFYDPENPESYPRGEPSLIDLRDFKGKAFQLFLSDFTLNSFMKPAFYEGKDLYITDIIGKFLHMKPLLTTDLVGRVFPQIKIQYGSGKPVNIRIRFVDTNQYPTIEFEDNSSNFTANSFEIGFIIGKKEVLTFNMGKLEMIGNLESKDFKIHGHLNDPVIKDL